MIISVVSLDVMLSLFTTDVLYALHVSGNETLIFVRGQLCLVMRSY